MGSLGYTNRVTALCFRGDSLEANASTSLQPSWQLGLPWDKKMWEGGGAQLSGTPWEPQDPFLSGSAVLGYGFLCPSPHNLREADIPTEFWKQVSKAGPVCADAWAGP